MFFLFGTCIKNHKQRIYIDFAATTTCDERVVKKMKKYWTLPYGNANSKHRFGFRSKQVIETAQNQIAELIQADANEIIFTSGATESNMIALTGIAYAQKERGKNHIITCVIEHKSVLDVCQKLEKEGFRITYLKVNAQGLVSLEELEKAINEKTALVSVMWINNEIGTIQPIQEIAAICRKKGVIFHTDAAQALGKVDIQAHDVDCMSLSSHKIYGPQGIGALYLKKGLKLYSPYGDKIRPGTLPTALCVGFGMACTLLKKDEVSEEWIQKIQSVLMTKGELNGDLNKRVPYVWNICFKKFPIELVQNVAISQGAACLKKPSYVLKALGKSSSEIDRSFRLSLGRMTTKEEVEKIITYLNNL